MAVSAMLMYMYNTTAAALTEGAGGQEDSSEEEAGKSAPAKTGKPKGKKGGLQESAIQRNQDPDTHSAAKVKEPSTTDEARTGNVD